MHVFLHPRRHANASGLSEPLETGRNVDAVAVNCIGLANDVADMDADAELDAALRRHVGVARGHAALNIHRTTYGIHHADELNDHPVAGGIDDAPTMPGDFGINQFFAVCLELAKRALLVGTHQPAVSSDIGREDGCQSPPHALFSHVYYLATGVMGQSLWASSQCVY